MPSHCPVTHPGPQGKLMGNQTLDAELPPSQDEPKVMTLCGLSWNMDNDHTLPSADTMRDVRCVGDQASFRPRAIQTQRYSVRKPGIILIRATFHVARKGMTD